MYRFCQKNIGFVIYFHTGVCYNDKKAKGGGIQMDFNGKVALITGASVGIGRAAAMRFAELGADLVLADINFEKLQSVKAELAHYGRDVLIYPCDVSDESRVNEITAYAMTHFGKVDILVNNAALWRNWSKFEETPIELWKKFLNVNVMSVVYFTNAVLPKMKEQNYGRIINVCSVAGVYGNANMACYSATKAAVIGMSKALAKEVAKQGITVNAVSPGSVSPAENPDPNFHQPSELAFMGRTGTDMENANLICFLASDEAAYISAQNIQIDGCRKKQ